MHPAATNRRARHSMSPLRVSSSGMRFASKTNPQMSSGASQPDAMSRRSRRWPRPTRTSPSWTHCPASAAPWSGASSPPWGPIAAVSRTPNNCSAPAASPRCRNPAASNIGSTPPTSGRSIPLPAAPGPASITRPSAPAANPTAPPFVPQEHNLFTHLKSFVLWRLGCVATAGPILFWLCNLPHFVLPLPTSMWVVWPLGTVFMS